MGICLDTEQNKDELESRSGVRSRRDSAWPDRATPPAASFPMQNSSHVKFEPPNVPVIFVLGGPGSGKVTHCDNLMQERRGMVHINMTDLLQQYAVGNNMQDFGNLSSTTVAEVLMLEMKMAPTAKTYLVSGYPRSMRDVAEYTEKIQTITGVVLVSWRKRVLERQIEYGARLGHVVLSLARMELDNFYGHVMPVAEYFDQSGMLIAVNGERNPEDVYEDFRTAILQILGSVEEPNLNGISGVGADGIPGEIVGIEPAPVRNRERHVKSRGEVRNPGLDVRSRGRDVRDAEVVDDPLPAAVPVAMPNGNMARIVSPKDRVTNEHTVHLMPEVIKVRGTTTRLPTLWVVGGPGSNKATLCQRAVLQRQGWMHFSLGQRLRALAEAGGGPGSEGALARAAVSGGEPAAGELAARLVRAAAGEAARLHCGLLLDGFPRDLQQMHMFQDEFHVTPRMVLLDCSKLQLGRGRRDDSVAAFRRRLEVFREHSLPMLKTLDQHHRLVIVDGDTDSTEVQAEFTRVLLEEMEKAEAIAEMPEEEAQTTNINAQPHAQLTHNIEESTLQRIAALPRQQNGSLPNGVVHNGFIPNNKVKPIANVTKISTISQMTHDDVKRLYQQSTGEVSLNTHHI